VGNSSTEALQDAQTGTQYGVVLNEKVLIPAVNKTAAIKASKDYTRVMAVVVMKTGEGKWKKL